MLGAAKNYFNSLTLFCGGAAPDLGWIPLDVEDENGPLLVVYGPRLERLPRLEDHLLELCRVAPSIKVVSIE